jgi:hypothetical protein
MNGPLGIKLFFVFQDRKLKLSAFNLFEKKIRQLIEKMKITVV